MAASKGKEIVVFLDYDGTLSPIVEDPDRAFMTREVRIVRSSSLYIYAFLLLVLVVCIYDKW